MPISDERRAANDQRVAEDVREYGCHVISVFDPQEKRPFFPYSVGIFETSGVPEAIVVGLAPKLGCSIVKTYNPQVRAGTRFLRGRLYEGFIDGFSVYVEPANSDLLADYTLGCDRYYKGTAYSV